MIGAIAGDIIGSSYEHWPIKSTDFPLFDSSSRFTDDTVLTIAVAKAIMEEGNYLEAIIRLGRKYADAGYGGAFRKWLASDSHEAYGSWGNGSAMRVSPVGFAFNTVDEVLREARRTAEISHNHPEGIRGAQAVALAVYLARTTGSRDVIREEISGRFGYDLNRSVEEIRPGYHFEVSCRRSVPEAIIAFLDSENFEEAIRNAVSLGGDADTQACIAGGIAQACYGQIPHHIADRIPEFLTDELLEITEEFTRTFL